MRSGRKPESKADRAARHGFYEAVLEKNGGECYLAPHIDHACLFQHGMTVDRLPDNDPNRTILDPCHIIPKERLKDHTITLSPEKRRECVWDERNAFPGCRFIHSRIDGRQVDAFLEWLPPGALDFAEDWDLVYLLYQRFPPLHGSSDRQPPFFLKGVK